MGKVGKFIVDPKVGAYCDVTLDNGEKVIVNHDKGSLKGGHVSLEKKKWMGLGSDRLFVCDLDTPAGKGLLARLTRDAPADSARATPIGAFAEYVKECKSADDAKVKLEALLTGA
jgi:hypothetical protein